MTSRGSISAQSTKRWSTLAQVPGAIVIELEVETNYRWPKRGRDLDTPRRTGRARVNNAESASARYLVRMDEGSRYLNVVGDRGRRPIAPTRQMFTSRNYAQHPSVRTCNDPTGRSRAH
jgi:hypothetical protein